MFFQIAPVIYYSLVYKLNLYCLFSKVKPLLNIARADEEMREKAEEVIHAFQNLPGT